MQYHQDGFRPGDPRRARAVATERRDEVDVLIVGCGPAGLTLAAQLAQFGDIDTRIVERKEGPLEVGQADGIACRSMEMFEAFGFADRVAAEAYQVSETVFWRPGPDFVLHRADRIQDVEDDLSEMPHVILSQARVHDFYLEVMANGPRRLAPDYGRTLTGLSIDRSRTHPVTATLKSPVGEETIRARYVVGCDGARSAVRAAIGHELKGASARQLWGVMDILAITDFPDIRFKAAIQSADQGALLIIPREGGHMVRFYIELDALREGERAAERGVTAETLIAKARAILAPYSLDVRQVAWWSAYEIGQRVCDGFDDVAEADRGQIAPHVFIAGDACHTHSPKAGQGMNVSMADAFNLGWKLAAVLRGQAAPALLDTYSEERRAKARELIEFDRDMARLFSERATSPEAAAQFQRYFQKHGRYTAGVETLYEPSIITSDGAHQALATGLKVGMRCHSAPVIRLADGKPMQLGYCMKADGRWRLMLFAPDPDGGEMDALCRWLQDDPNSPLRRFTPEGDDSDAVIDVRAVYQRTHRDMSIDEAPALLRPATGWLGLIDYERVFCVDQRDGRDIYDMRGVDRERGALVVVRPDQYVATILPLSARGEITAFFDRFMRLAREA
ncbi:MAG: FAD-dependent monooxygenase [Pseudomonadota bacterium]